MNKVQLIGRLVRDTELKTAGENKYTRFTIAVDKKMSKENKKQLEDEGKPTADFIGCVAWNKSAEIINQYFGKGSLIGISGRIQTGSYEREDGTTAYTQDIIVDEFYFLEKKLDSRPAPEYEETKKENDTFKDFGETVEEDDLPF